jgi:hypothetical protein
MEGYNGRNQSPSNSTSAPSPFGLGTIILLVLGMVAIYYLYRFLYTSADNNTIVLSGGKRSADSSPEKLPTIPTPYEGGEYSFNTWIYISSFNKNRNARKHIFELRGRYFSTLVVALGAFNNTLVVRTHTKDAGAEGFQAMGVTIPKLPLLSDTKEGFQSTAGSGSGPTTMTTATATTTSTPKSSEKPGDLSAEIIKSFFKPFAVDDSLLVEGFTTPAVCDLPEVDMQRWTMISVVLTGRTIDVYLDGKLSRSCMSSSYYKVDPTGVTPVLTDHGGFDGYMGRTEVANYAMNPDEIYRTYLSGPDGPPSLDIIGWIGSLFKGST